MHYLGAPQPSDDQRWKPVNAAMRRHGHRSDALIEVLHAVQENFGHLDPDALRYVASSLRVPLSRVQGVATFYHFFSLEPRGEHSCIVCTGTACYIKGVPEILDAMEARFGIRPGETTPDGRLSLGSARCLGACGQAPIVVFDDDLLGKVTAGQAVAHAERCCRHADA